MIDAELSQEQLKNEVSYDPETGLFVWRVTRRRGFQIDQVAGEIAGHKHSRGYISLRVFGVKYLAHRLAFFYMTGKWPEGDTDHKNGDKTDNSWANIRSTSRTQNMFNTVLQSNNSSGVKGVSFDKKLGKWTAQIQFMGKKIHLGCFDSVELATQARRMAERDYVKHIS